MKSTRRISQLRLRCLLLTTFSLVLAIGCDSTAHDYLSDARQGLSDASYDDAIAAVELGLAATPDEKTAWGLEMGE